jgi:pyridoxine/pyridoxamine 5'-phosphate oxidase
MRQTESNMNLFELAKEELLKSDKDREHPFCMFFMATAGDYPELRTIISRKIDPDLSILFYTDPRSPKVEQIRENNRVSALFYHPEKKLQVRIKGKAYLIENIRMLYPQLLEHIKNSPLKKDFTALEAPGSVVEENYTPRLGSEIFFEAVRIVPDEIDILQVGKDEHLRCLCTEEKGVWKQERLVP